MSHGCCFQKGHSFKGLENMLSIIATHYGELIIIDEKNRCKGGNVHLSERQNLLKGNDIGFTDYKFINNITVYMHAQSLGHV